MGWNTWEELNLIPDLSSARNFGWPCFEGNATQYTGLNICPTFADTTPPFYTYRHADPVVTGDGCATRSSSVAGMAFYQATATTRPPTTTRCSSRITRASACGSCFRTATAIPTPPTGPPSPPPPAGPWICRSDRTGISTTSTSMAAAFAGRVRTGRQGVRHAARRALPLTVNFSSAGSAPAQPDETITFAWDLDGDGAFDDSTAANPCFAYTNPGTYAVRLRVTDNLGAFNVSDPLEVTAGNEDPTATINGPLATLTWQVNQELNFAGQATDPQDGNLPASALSWIVGIDHCPSDCHAHPYRTFNGVARGGFPAPDHEYPAHLEIQLTATDAGGLQHTPASQLQPKTVNLQFQSVPTGLELSAGTFTGTTPFTRQTIGLRARHRGALAAGPERLLLVVRRRCPGARDRVANNSATYTATYLPLIRRGPQDVGTTGARPRRHTSPPNTPPPPPPPIPPPQNTTSKRMTRDDPQPPTPPPPPNPVLPNDRDPHTPPLTRLTTDPPPPPHPDSDGDADAPRAHRRSPARRPGPRPRPAPPRGPRRDAPEPHADPPADASDGDSQVPDSDGHPHRRAGPRRVRDSTATSTPPAPTPPPPSPPPTATPTPTPGGSNVPPSVWLTSPIGGSLFTAPASITLTATASDPDGTVTRVDFYDGSRFLGTDPTAPYALSWTDAGEGAHS